VRNKAADATAEKRRQIIEGAAALFTRHGYEGASMADIAAGAGVSKGTLYNYFACKSDLFAAFVGEMAQGMLPQLFDGIDTLPPREALVAIGERVLRKMLSQRSLDLYRVVVSEAGQFPHLAQIFFDALPRRARETLVAWIDRQVTAGELSVADPIFAADQFFALLHTRIVVCARLQLPRDESDAALRHVANAAADMFIAFYRRPTQGE
jgi:TetR/AcrR family transcriptional regulator, mexJK operon transcriptional repressor